MPSSDLNFNAPWTEKPHSQFYLNYILKRLNEAHVNRERKFSRIYLKFYTQNKSRGQWSSNETLIYRYHPPWNKPSFNKQYCFVYWVLINTASYRFQNELRCATSAQCKSQKFSARKKTSAFVSIYLPTAMMKEASRCAKKPEAWVLCISPLRESWGTVIRECAVKEQGRWAFWERMYYDLQVTGVSTF